jgi:hypothetical protein
MHILVKPTFLKGQKNINSLSPNFGAFGYYTQVSIQWLACRDGWQNTPQQTLKDRGMFFCVESFKIPDLAKFLHIIEYKLKVKTYTKFQRTNLADVIWLKLSPFWLKGLMRRSFFTLLLRCGRDYKITEDNFEEALFSHAYSSQSKLAVERFLNGYTCYKGMEKYIVNGNYSYAPPGWHSVFAYASSYTVRKLLVKRKKK